MKYATAVTFCNIFFSSLVLLIHFFLLSSASWHLALQFAKEILVRWFDSFAGNLKSWSTSSYQYACLGRHSSFLSILWTFNLLCIHIFKYAHEKRHTFPIWNKSPSMQNSTMTSRMKSSQPTEWVWMTARLQDVMYFPFYIFKRLPHKV